MTSLLSSADSFKTEIKLDGDSKQVHQMCVTENL